MTVKFSIPANFSTEHINALSIISREFNKKEENFKKDYICNVYGSLPISSMGHARASDSVPQIDIDDLSKYVNQLLDLDIPFHYTLNNLWSGGIERTVTGQNIIHKEIENILETGVKGLIIANPYLIKLIKKWFPKAMIIASINLRINSLAKIQFYMDMGVNHIVLDRDINRNFKILESGVKLYKDRLTLLVNSTCHLYCALQDYHTLESGFLSSKTENNTKTELLDKNYCFNYCIDKYLNDFVNFLKSPCIIPEYISHYEKIGINHFKIQGRTMSVQDQVNLIKFYFNRETADKDLFSIWPGFKETLLKSSKNEDLIEIEKRLKINIDLLIKISFIENFIDNPNNCRAGCYQCEYCKRKYIQMLGFS